MPFNNNDPSTLNPWRNPWSNPYNPLAPDQPLAIDPSIDHLASLGSTNSILQSDSPLPVDPVVDPLPQTEPSFSLFPNCDSIPSQQDHVSAVEAWHKDYHAGDEPEEIEYWHSHEAESELHSIMPQSRVEQRKKNATKTTLLHP